uniref:Uncharacterized protein n=1 Tax=Tanacetum cinerariifolium TaxID=118510 RepID=A0A699JN00_TANCI|nr:hypothetical protein [Tanacetum cinerariifolium]
MTLKLSSSISIRSMLKGWFCKFRVHPRKMVSVATDFPSANSSWYIISRVVGITFSSGSGSGCLGFGFLGLGALLLTFILTMPFSSTTKACSGWSFVFVVPSQMTHLVASIILDIARSYVMQGAFLTQGTISSVPNVLSWGGSIRLEGFWPSILLLTVIIVTVATVVAVVLVIVDTIIGIVVVVGAPSIIKLAFVITGSLHRTMLYYLIHQPLGYVDGFI